MLDPQLTWLTTKQFSIRKYRRDDEFLNLVQLEEKFLEVLIMVWKFQDHEGWWNLQKGIQNSPKKLLHETSKTKNM